MLKDGRIYGDVLPTLLLGRVQSQVQAHLPFPGLRAVHKVAS